MLNPLYSAGIVPKLSPVTFSAQLPGQVEFDPNALAIELMALIAPESWPIQQDVLHTLGSHYN